MANSLFDQYRQDCIEGGGDLATANVASHLLDAADHTTDTALDRDLADIASAAIEEVSGNFSSKTTTDGVFDAADVTFTAAAGDPVEELNVYINTGTAATSSMVANFDTASNLPLTLNGSDVVAQWNAGGILSI